MRILAIFERLIIGLDEMLAVKRKSPRLEEGYNAWCLETESDRRHRDFQSLALPTELSRQIEQQGEF